MKTSNDMSLVKSILAAAFLLMILSGILSKFGIAQAEELPLPTDAIITEDEEAAAKARRIIEGIAKDVEDGKARMMEALNSGAGLAKLKEMIEAQGGDGRVCDDCCRYCGNQRNGRLDCGDSSGRSLFDFDGCIPIRQPDQIHSFYHHDRIYIRYRGDDFCRTDQGFSRTYRCDRRTFD